MGSEAQYKNAMALNAEEGEYSEPVSPTGQYFNSSALSIGVLGVLDSEIPIDDSPTMKLLEDVFLPINPRFSSVMVYIYINIYILLHFLFINFPVYVSIHLCACSTSPVCVHTC